MILRYYRWTPKNAGAYSASKFAMEAITNCQRMELAKWGISVSAIEPGFVETPLLVGMADLDKIYSSLLPEAKKLYSMQIEKGATIVHKMKYAISPKHVVDKVLHAISSPTPKTRYLVGYDAHIIAFLVWVLPDRLQDVITQLF